MGFYLFNKKIQLFTNLMRNDGRNKDSDGILGVFGFRFLCTFCFKIIMYEYSYVDYIVFHVHRKEKTVKKCQTLQQTRFFGTKKMLEFALRLCQNHIHESDQR